MNSADGTIHFNLSFSQNSVYLHVRLRERFVNPQLLKQLAVYKIKEGFYKNDSARFYFILFSVMSLVLMFSCQMILGFSLKNDKIGKICGLVIVAVFEAVILYFVIHAICNSNLYNQVMLLEEMFVQKVF